ncbi:hypothetical protein CU048_11220 [Beijerinckiaceae bacterium]|nr:hypothetical protein CU048_11220 [Beijerinckiaceae bacterium]
MQRLFIPSLFALMPAGMASASRLRRRVGPPIAPEYAGPKRRSAFCGNNYDKTLFRRRSAVKRRPGDFTGE